MQIAYLLLGVAEVFVLAGMGSARIIPIIIEFEGKGMQTYISLNEFRSKLHGY